MTETEASKIKRSSSQMTIAADNLVKLWLYRALLKLDGSAGMLCTYGWEDPWLTDFLDVADCTDEKDDPSLKFLKIKLRQLLENYERKSVRKSVPKTLLVNVERIGKVLPLTPVSRQLLAFVIILHNSRSLACGLELLNILSNNNLYHALSAILDIPEKMIRSELCQDSPLIRSGLLQLTQRRCRFQEKIVPLSIEFAERMMIPQSGGDSIFNDIFFRSSSPTLTRKDYSQVESQFDILSALLNNNGGAINPGVNVLIYGVPGVGKTEFARLLAQETGLTPYEVASAAIDGEPFEGKQRIDAYRAAACLLERGKNLLIFDEAEDIFGNGNNFFGPPSIAQTRKAWMNRALEQNHVPTIWLTNAIEGIDSAFMRRFSMVIEMKVPTRSCMQEMVRDVAGDLLTSHSIDRLAEIPQLSPAVLSCAARVVRSVRHVIGQENADEAMRLIVNGTLVAQGYNGMPRQAANDGKGIYSTNYIAADVDLARIAAGIRNARRGRLCLYGPPGTGKSAFGRWLADEIDAPLHVKRISDILSPYVGKSEQQLAKVFRDASAEHAVLMLDEVDSFLQDRKGARHSWEITQVNEMLTQMEAFDGVFIASTNLMDGLDEAALRRFDLKVKLGFLKSDQAVALLHEYCRELELGSVSDSHRATVASIQNLTPGDYATIARRHGFSPLVSASEFVGGLQGEARMKREGRMQAMGFVVNG